MKKTLSNLLANTETKIIGRHKLLRNLNKSEKGIYEDFKNSLFAELQGGGVRISYRGDNRTFLKKTMFKGTDKYSDFRFYSRIFNIGGKTKNCYTGGRNFTIGNIEDVSLSVFENVFKDLCDIFNNYINCPDIGPRVRIFKKNNPNIFNYFLNASNLSNFKTLLLPLLPADMLLIRDYYIYLIHVFGVTQLYSDTPLISTSYSLDVAKYFGTNEHRHDDCLVYIYLITDPIDEVGIDEKYLDEFKRFKQFSNFPLIHKTVFSQEREISVFGALFTHCIFGVYDMKKGKIVLNSHLFMNGNETRPDSCSQKGFYIPEHYFHRDFKDSKYLKGVCKIGRNFKDLKRTT